MAFLPPAFQVSRVSRNNIYISWHIPPDRFRDDLNIKNKKITDEIEF
jgi:hypothetical protein